MRYARWDGTIWEKEDIVQRTGILSPSLVLDLAGEARIAYIVDSGGELDYASRLGGPWTVDRRGGLS